MNPNPHAHSSAIPVDSLFPDLPQRGREPAFSAGPLSRRHALGVVLSALLYPALRATAASDPDSPNYAKLAEDVHSFIKRSARDDGGYAPSPDPDYRGNSDTGLSDLAAVTYAATLSRTMGWQLPHPKKSIQFIHNHQQTDGSFVNLGGTMDPKSNLAILYNTVQGVVALRALGEKPKKDPSPIMTRFFEKEAFRKLPWYTTSFFPLFYAALGQPFPKDQQKALTALQVRSQTPDGYLGDHVAASFHMVHYFRLLGKPTPNADKMVARVLRDQKSDGGWNIKEPDWDVHACFDAVFILRQLGGDSEPVRRAIAKAADWVLTCRNSDGGFGHYPQRHSDMDAVYFQFGTLIQAGRIPGAKSNLPDAHLLSWGHAMQPGMIYPA